MSGQRMSPHWWPEGWRLLAAAVPEFLHASRSRRLVLVASAGAVIGGACGTWIWRATEGDATTVVPGIVLYALLGVAIGSMICLYVFRRGDRPDFPVDGYVSDQQDRDVRDAIRAGDFSTLPVNVRRYLTARAEQNRAALPSLLITELVSILFLAIFVAGMSLLSGARRGARGGADQSVGSRLT